MQGEELGAGATGTSSLGAACHLERAARGPAARSSQLAYVQTPLTPRLRDHRGRRGTPPIPAPWVLGPGGPGWVRNEDQMGNTPVEVPPAPRRPTATSTPLQLIGGARAVAAVIPFPKGFRMAHYPPGRWPPPAAGAAAAPPTGSRHGSTGTDVGRRSPHTPAPAFARRISNCVYRLHATRAGCDGKWAGRSARGHPPGLVGNLQGTLHIADFPWTWAWPVLGPQGASAQMACRGPMRAGPQRVALGSEGADKRCIRSQ